MREPWRPSSYDYSDKAYQQACRRLSRSICRDTVLYVLTMFAIKGAYVMAMSGPPGWMHFGDIALLGALGLAGVTLIASIFADLKALTVLRPPRMIN